jgi:hypothetical protein
MILTPVPRCDLAQTLDRFSANLCDARSRRAFRFIRETSSDRAAGTDAERHRLEALGFARSLGMAVHSSDRSCQFNWDGAALNGATEAYVILHEAAHFVLATPQRRRLVDFGLGAGPDTLDRERAEREATLPGLARDEDEARASLLGILWEAALGQPALASFLDQNWLEGSDRAAAHFTRVHEELMGRQLPLPAARLDAGLF